MKVIDATDDNIRDRITNDADRIGVLADEVGQVALFSVTRHSAAIKDLPSGYSRGLWVFIHAYEEFERAEEARFADGRRSGRMWAGYFCETGCVVPMVGEAIAGFESAVATHFDSRHTKVEVCHRSRPRLEAPDIELVQATIYREGRPEERKAFVKGQLDRLPDRPVLEAVITYEPASGVIEVIAAGGDDREVLVRLFADHMLRAPFGGARVAIRQYRLDHLRERQAFPTVPDDDIDHVEVKLLRLMPHDTEGERVTLECLRGAKRDIWDVADGRFGERNPLRNGYTVTKARLSVKFGSVKGVRGPRTLPVTVSMPHGCDLKERTERERLIGQKYLRRWGFIRDV